MKTLLTIAGFDPSSGAGVTADLAVFAAHGCFGMSAVTALTVQSTLGVKAVHLVEPAILGDTLRLLAADILPDGVKIGMLGSEANVDVVAEFLVWLRDQGCMMPVVLDPVIRSSSRRELLSEAGVNAIRERLLPLVDWVTPNVEELALLTGKKTETAAEIEAGALGLAGAHPGLSVVATGGDGEAADDLVVLADGRMEWLRGEKIESLATHGTGCAYSSALACALAGGEARPAAQAKRYVAEAIRRAKPIGHGRGPMNLLWTLSKE